MKNNSNITFYIGYWLLTIISPLIALLSIIQKEEAEIARKTLTNLSLSYNFLTVAIILALINMFGVYIWKEQRSVIFYFHLIFALLSLSFVVVSILR
jgi:hypothetical protein